MKKLLLIFALLLACKPAHATADIYSGLQCWYPLDSNTISGTTVNDKSGNSKNGTSHNSPTLTAGILGQALNLASASSMYVDISTNTYNPGSGDFTLSAWMYSNVSGTAVMISTNSSSGSNNYWLGQTTGSAFNFAVDGVNTTSSVNGNDQKWHLVTGTRISGSTTIYVDGKSTGTGSGSGTVTAVLETIGRDGLEANFYWNGYADDVREYNRGLSAAEVRMLYLMGKGMHSNQP